MRRRIIDWHTPDGLDPETPVADLHDHDDAGRDALVLFSDEERRCVAWMLDTFGPRQARELLVRALDHAREREEVVKMRNERTRWHDRAWNRAAVIIAVVAALNLPQWLSLFHRP